MNNENRRILIVDDEAYIRTLVCGYLRMKDFQMLETKNSREALKVSQREPDIALILLDVMIPEMDGFETLREFRHISDMPMLMLATCVGEQSELQGSSLDVDEHIVKPFSPGILLARIDATLKRTSAGTSDEQFEAAGICLDEHAHEVAVDGKKVELNFREFELFHYFLENQGIVPSREKILNHIWNYGYFDNARAIDTHMKELRTKMGERGALI